MAGKNVVVDGTEAIASLSGLTLSNANYTLAGGSGAVTVTPAALSIAATSQSATYGTATPLAGYTAAGVQAGDAITGLTEVFASGGSTTTAHTNAGSYAITPSAVTGLTLADYAITYAATGTLTVNPLAVTLAGSQVYNGTTQVAGGNLAAANLVGGDVLTIGGTGTMAGKNVVVDGTEAISSLSGLTLSNANYTLAGGSGAVTVTPKSVTAALVGPVEKIYDGSVAATLVPGNYSIDGIVSGDTVGLNNPATGIYADANAGKGINVRVGGLALSGNGTSNYVLTGTDISAPVGTIDPRPIQVTANDEAKQVGQPDPALAYQVSSGTLVSGDAFSGSLQREPGELQGSYAIDQGSLLLSANYTLSFTAGLLTIISPPPPASVQAPANGQTSNAANTAAIVFAAPPPPPATSPIAVPSLGQDSFAPYPDNQYVSASIRFRRPGAN